MSWEVRGTVYHDPAAYRAAQQRANEESAAQRSARLTQEVGQIRTRISERTESLSRGGLTVAQRQRLQEELRTDTQRLQAIDREVTGEAARMQLELAKQAAEFAAHAAAMGVSVDGVAAEQARHAAEVKKQFEATSHAVAEAAKSAESARAEGERRLQDQIKTLDDKLSEERRAKEKAAKSVAARVIARCELVEAGLVPMSDTDLERLALGSEKERCRQTAAAARRLAEGGNPEAGLGMAESAAVALAALEREVSRREAAIQVRKASFETRLRSTVARLADEGVTQWFGEESQLLARTGTKLADRLDERYGRYEQLEAQGLQDEMLVREIESQAAAMSAAVASLVAMEPIRCSSEESMLSLLEKSYGPLTEINEADTYVRAGDPKSARRWSLRYGGARVILEVGLQGEVRVDGYGHQSNQACADRAASVVAEMRQAGTVSAASVDATNRTQEHRSQTLHEAGEVKQAVDRIAARVG